jgi:N6-adenosine-specific RNA methylase IME4
VTATPPPRLAAPFRVIFADPAWRFRDRLRMSTVKRGAEDNYRTMTIAEIAALPVARLASDDAVLVLWRPSSLAKPALDVLEGWGFRQTGELVWNKVKPNGRKHFGMGRLTRAAKEVAWVGVRGRPYRHLATRSERDTFEAPPLRHSAKPEIVQDAFERMFPGGPFLELYARRERPGWVCVGNECPGTVGRDLRDVLAEMIRDRAAA